MKSVLCTAWVNTCTVLGTVWTKSVLANVLVKSELGTAWVESV